MNKRRAIYNRLIVLLTMATALCFSANGQTVREKLSQPAEYRPRAIEPDEQLIEVARHFKLPIAIEWLNEKPASGNFRELEFKKGSVLDLIRAIVARVPHHNLTLEDRIVRVYPPSAVNSELNFLNLRLTKYCVSDESVYGANYAVRLGLDMMLYPEQFQHGFGGGYGGGEERLWIRTVNICLNKPSIRELLTEIVAQSGQAGWVARINPEELSGEKPFWKGVPINEYGTSPITGHWQIFALVEPDR